MKSFSTLDFSKHVSHAMTLWRYDITVENIVKYTIMKYITYTRHYTRLYKSKSSKTKLTDLHYLGAELTWRGRLAGLGKISPSLRNTYKNIMCLYEILRGSHLGEVKIFHISTRKWVSPARWDRVYFNQFCFVFEILIK